MIRVNTEKFQHHFPQGHCILMSLIQLYNIKEYFSKYEIAGISEKLIGEMFMEYGNILTPFKFSSCSGCPLHELTPCFS